MAVTPCLDCGTLTFARRGRCPACHDRLRSRYGATHQAERRRWAELVATGSVYCTRCDQPIQPGDTWDLDHRPWGTLPAHARCNRSAGGKHCA